MARAALHDPWYIVVKQHDIHTLYWHFRCYNSIVVNWMEAKKSRMEANKGSAWFRPWQQTGIVRSSYLAPKDKKALS
jgi:hypothetical protein